MCSIIGCNGLGSGPQRPAYEKFSSRRGGNFLFGRMDEASRNIIFAIEDRIPFVHYKKVILEFLEGWNSAVYRRKRYREQFLDTDSIFNNKRHELE